MACSTFKVSPRLSVLCFRREGSPDPYFVVREFDTKVIRSPAQHKKGRGPSEQAIRASIRQAILNMSLKSERASKLEIRQLKAQGILGKRAPSCSLLNSDDMLRLLEAFGKHSHARDLRIALKKENNFSPLPMRSEEVRPRKRRHRSSANNTKRPRVTSDNSRLDALLSALKAQEPYHALTPQPDAAKLLHEVKQVFMPTPEPEPVKAEPVEFKAEVKSANTIYKEREVEMSDSTSPSRSPSPSSSRSSSPDREQMYTPQDDHAPSPSPSPSPSPTSDQSASFSYNIQSMQTKNELFKSVHKSNYNNVLLQRPGLSKGLVTY